MLNNRSTMAYSADNFNNMFPMGKEIGMSYIDKLFGMVCSQLSINATAPPEDCVGEGASVTTERAPDQPGDTFFALLGVSECSKVFFVVTLALILTAALLGNVTVLTTVMINRNMWTTMHVFIVSLAIADILVCQVLTTEWTFGSLTCQLMPFFMQMSVTASILTLCCMAAERYVAIIHPLKLHLLQSTERVVLLLVAVWLVAFAAGAPYAYYYDTRDLCGQRLPSGQCAGPVAQHTICSVREGNLFAAAKLQWLTFLILFLLPTLVLGITYGIIIYRLWVKAPVGVVMISAAGMRTRYKRKAIKMLLLVVVLFLASWAPLLTFDVVTMTDHGIHVSSSLMTLRYSLQCLSLSSTAYNPIVYAFMNKNFRTNFQTLLLRNRARVAPIVEEKEIQQEAGGAKELKTGGTNSGVTKGSTSPMQTKSSKL